MIDNRPLAERLRPLNLDDYIGQEHLLGQGGILKKQIEQSFIPSMIFWGPPGIGKTTLAHLIAKQTKRDFFKISAINSGIKEVREIIDKAKSGKGLFTVQNPILFIDEIHRFNKTQQDSLLEAVERGWVTLIGATTENPSFEIISALLSRCQVYVLNYFTEQELKILLDRAIIEDTLLKQKNIILKETQALFQISSGDARKMLNTFEIVVNAYEQNPIVITNEKVLEIVQQNIPLYDKSGEQHYDIASAFIKSIRGSDPNAAVYWLARMIISGEDATFIARRMIISASEDIGNANPMALVLANNTFDAVSKVGFPEARIILSQCAIYLATSAKSNASYKAINQAIDYIKENGVDSVPIHLRNAPTHLMKKMGYGADYLYAHNYPNHFVFQDYLPDNLQGYRFYEPSNGKENQLRTYLKSLWGDRYGY